MADNDRVDLPAEFDALLRRTLAVEPSPEFLPRVRERVSQQGRPSRWTAPWLFAATAAAATLALAIGVAWLPGAPAVTPAPPAAPAPVVAASARPVPPPPAIPRAASPRPRTIPARPVRAAHESPAAPVVIVDQRQRAALGTLFRMLELGRVSSESFAATVPVSLEPIAEQVPAITVEPVVVSAMPWGGVLHHDSER
jgi:hypothetical protein